ncbi:MAG: ATP-binding protein, partial [Candidatus Hodarchaeales archaeon]
DGTPIPDENRAKIFQRGFTTKEDGGGLGLTIVKKLIEAHGWQIAFEETPETTFSIHIPADSL